MSTHEAHEALMLLLLLVDNAFCRVRATDLEAWKVCTGRRGRSTAVMSKSAVFCRKQ